jgi:hypothetical protein
LDGFLVVIVIQRQVRRESRRQLNLSLAGNVVRHDPVAPVREVVGHDIIVAAVQGFAFDRAEQRKTPRDGLVA